MSTGFPLLFKKPQASGGRGEDKFDLLQILPVPLLNKQINLKID